MGKQKDVTYILYKNLPHPPSYLLPLISYRYFCIHLQMREANLPASSPQHVLYGGKHADVLWMQSERKLSGFQSDCLNYLVICRLPQQSALWKVAECYICPLIYKKFPRPISPIKNARNTNLFLTFFI